MKVSEYLDLEDDGELLGQARESWTEWAEREPRLSVVAFDELRTWLKEAGPAEADEVLLALATLAASDGGDEVAAAAVLAWVLLPGACSIVRRLRGLRVDAAAVVAGQLWIEVRSFPWKRLRKVAANVLMNTRAACLRECDIASQVKRTDRTWSSTDVMDPASPTWERIASVDGARPQPVAAFADGNEANDSAREVTELLEWACENSVISFEDCALLQCLLVEADRVDVRRVRRTNCGLTATAISAQVAPQCGVGQATVRRRAARSIRALAGAVDRYEP